MFRILPENYTHIRHPVSLVCWCSGAHPQVLHLNVRCGYTAAVSGYFALERYANAKLIQPVCKQHPERNGVIASRECSACIIESWTTKEVGESVFRSFSRNADTFMLPPAHFHSSKESNTSLFSSLNTFALWATPISIIVPAFIPARVFVYSPPT